jgi:asparagine synthase (glutamine-hydrolysing)
MCGIVGIVSTRSGSVGPDRLVRMRDTMIHRGPDGAGVWWDREGRVGLAHRRLAIIDLSDAGAQPMASADGRLQLVYNGEIYNHLDLRFELEAKGYRFRSRTDTEVILHGYREWGEKLLDRLIGMFAFAVWDSEASELFAARDRIGIKPLYFCDHGGELLFASEIKALVADPAVPREIEPVSAWHYLTFIVPPAPLTMFRGIYKLPAGHLLRARLGRSPEIRRWWDLVDAPPPELDPSVYRDEEACAAELLRRLERSIERRMMSDVPFGVFLSGGIDSSTNVALMARHMDRPVDTFSVGFEKHEGYNELEFARVVSRRFATNHHEVIIGEHDMQAYLPDLIHQQDEPIADWVCVPLYFVSKLARDSGVIVVQVGEGSDELFCGYEHFLEPLDLNRRYGRPLRALPPPLRRGIVGLARLAGIAMPEWRRRAEIAARVARGEEIFWGGAVCYRGEIKDRIWRGRRDPHDRFPGFVPAPYRTFDSNAVVSHLLDGFRRLNPGADFYQQMLYLELRLRLPELLLMRVDKISMSTSVEARVPFLDHHLVEFAMDLPLRMRLRDRVGKYLLKKAVRGLLPDEIIARRKMGFGAPFREWFRGPFGRWAHDRLSESEVEILDLDAIRGLLREHRDERADWSFHLWVALNLALWHDHWIAGRGVEA